MKFLNKAIFLFFLLVFSLFVVSCSNRSTLPKQFSTYDLKATDLGSAIYYEYKSTTQKLLLKERKMDSRRDAIRFINDRSKLFYSIFEPQRVSYPGATTKNIICPDEYKPKRIVLNQSDYSIYYTGYANSNYIWGACSIDNIAFSSTHIFIYCQERKNVYVIDYFVSLTNKSLIDDFIGGLNCE